jgi:3-hydroxyanthranilate 3,4-dioxygenase
MSEGRVIEKASDFVVSVVSGPSRRKDYHVSPHEELFFQLDGELALWIRDSDGGVHEVSVAAGEIFALPANVPHSPQRPEGSVGLVIERRRRGTEDDTLRFYCDRCNCAVYEEGFSLEEAAIELADIFNRFWDDATLRTCRKCGAVVQPPVHGDLNSSPRPPAFRPVRGAKVSGSKAGAKAKPKTPAKRRIVARR